MIQPGIGETVGLAAMIAATVGLLYSNAPETRLELLVSTVTSRDLLTAMLIRVVTMSVVVLTMIVSPRTFGPAGVALEFLFLLFQSARHGGTRNNGNT